MLLRRRRRPTTPARRRRRRVVLLVVAVLLAVPGVSFAQAMAYPGDAPTSVRAVEWVRDHGGGGVVDTVETWWYTRHAPPRTGPPDERLPAAPTVAGAAAPPPVRLVAGLPRAAGEGVWRVAARATDGRPAVWTTWLRPDPQHAPLVAGIALLPQGTDVVHLVAGTREPFPDRSLPAAVPAADRPRLVAVLNAGFKMREAHGGWAADGRTLRALRTGAASLVVRSDGRADVEAWAGGRTAGPGVVAVRQNLDLLVVGGRPAAGLDSNAGGRWGNAHSQFQYTWRSGLGTDAAGDLVYVAGHDLTLATLAAAMVDAGIVTGMELDIHPHQVDLATFAAPSGPGTLLLPSMPGPADRYLVADQRDFFYVTSR